MNVFFVKCIELLSTDRPVNIALILVICYLGTFMSLEDVMHISLSLHFMDNYHAAN